MVRNIGYISATNFTFSIYHNDSMNPAEFKIVGPTFLKEIKEASCIGFHRWLRDHYDVTLLFYIPVVFQW